MLRLDWLLLIFSAKISHFLHYQTYNSYIIIWQIKLSFIFAIPYILFFRIFLCSSQSDGRILLNY
jgi:hypothetical protein